MTSNLELQKSHLADFCPQHRHQRHLLDTQCLLSLWHRDLVVAWEASQVFQLAPKDCHPASERFSLSSPFAGYQTFAAPFAWPGSAGVRNLSRFTKAGSNTIPEQIEIVSLLCLSLNETRWKSRHHPSALEKCQACQLKQPDTFLWTCTSWSKSATYAYPPMHLRVLPKVRPLAPTALPWGSTK